MTTFKQKIVNILAAFMAGILSVLMVISPQVNLYLITVIGLIIFYLVHQISKNDNI